MADTPADHETQPGAGADSEASGTELPEDIRAMSFEQALQELRQIVERLETGEGKLDDAITAYERGALLKRHCEHKLREAEAKIEKIKVDDSGAAGSEPLDVE